MKKKFFGFTLIELMIACVIVTILVTLAFVLYTPQMRKGRRADGMDSLAQIALAQEQYRSTNTTYGTLAQVWGSVSTTTGGYYTLTISNVTGSSYTLTATAIGDQANDSQDGTSCTPLVLAMSSGTITKTPSVCWPS